MIEIEIDGKKIEVQEGSMIMEAAAQLNIYIPHFCYHKKLSIAANCRMCLVDVEKAPKPLPACATPVTAGMVVRSASDRAVDAQKSVMEFLLINHPLDCPICDQGGECQLQDLAVGYGASASRYKEEKRVVVPKEIGPLISTRDMNRCIQCTRCVRFGQEIAGVMELGMLGRGEHSEITSFINKTVDSELSGNMIDVCPVGALTSKPFRYRARTWELSRRKSVSPHDSLGSNLIVQVKNHQVARVLPLENSAINECWLSDRDRFAYEGLNSSERLNSPMIKQNGQWRQTDWQTALDYIARGLPDIIANHGAQAVAGVAAPYATLEELFLLQKLIKAVGSSYVDFRLRQSDFELEKSVVPWLGMKVAECSELKNIFIIGSFLRQDHPLLTARFRQAAKNGAAVHVLHAVDEDLLMPTASKMIAPPSQWVSMLAEIVSAIAKTKNIALPVEFENLQLSENSIKIANSLLSTESSAVFIGNTAAQHPQASDLHVLTQWIAEQTNARFGYLTEAANTVGAYLAGAVSDKDKKINKETDNEVSGLFSAARKAFILLHTEPELDCADPRAARSALEQAEMVVVMSPYQQGLDYADVILPVAPFSETSGTFVNCAGQAQSFNGSVKPLAETRPAWKVLRVLGNLLKLDGFEYETSEAVRAEVLGVASTGNAIDLSSRLNNFSARPLSSVKLSPLFESHTIERITDIPAYSSDAIVRRSSPLQQTAVARAAQQVRISVGLAGRIQVTDGEEISLKQGNQQLVLPVVIDKTLHENVVRIPAVHEATSALGSMFGVMEIKKAVKKEMEKEVKKA